MKIRRNLHGHRDKDKISGGGAHNPYKNQGGRSLFITTSTDMSSHHPTMPCSTRSNSDFDEYQWVINIGRALEKELEDDGDESPVCIFTVPKTLMSSDPDS